MFSTEDVKEIFELFPPPYGHHGRPPLFVPASSGKGLITAERLQLNYERRVTQDTKRILVSDLAHDLDVSEELALQLVRNERQLAVISSDGREIIPKQELDMILEKLRNSLKSRMVSKDEFEAQNDMDFIHLRTLLGNEEPHVFYHGDHLCTAAYEKTLSEQALEVVNRAKNETTNIDLGSKDLEELPGSPPKWLFQRYLEKLVDFAEFKDDVFLRETPDALRVQSKHLRSNTIDGLAHPLQSGELAYIDLQELSNTCKAVFDSIEEVVSDFKKLPNIDVVESFAVSETWISNFVNQKLHSLAHEDTGAINITENLTEQFQHTKDNHRPFPPSLHVHIEHKAAHHLTASLSQTPNTDLHRFNTVVLTNAQYLKERTTFINRAQKTASTQWHILESDPSHAIKFTLPPTTSLPPTERLIHETLSKDKPLHKQCEETFWTAITAHETHNEASFATFWTERVVCRAHIYASGLTSIADTKLRDALSTLLASYVQNDVVPDALAKARAQNLVLSRKTRKNVSRFESGFGSDAAVDVDGVMASIEKFGARQDVPPPSTAVLAEFKSSMVQDMRRRMGKQRGNGPVLFLTLVVVLCARYCEGVVYATGKFAPKLMKMLKGKLGDEEFERLERWKEGAKLGTLGKEDAEGMVEMAGAA